MQLDALHSASSSKQQGYQHQLHHSGHHAPIDKETSMTAVKRLADHEACHLTFYLKRATVAKKPKCHAIALRNPAAITQAVSYTAR
ncbi:hypothetical protein ACFX13_036077 [Malus domestica]